MMVIVSLLMLLIGYFGIGEALEMKSMSSVSTRIGLYIVVIFIIAITLVSFI